MKAKTIVLGLFAERIDIVLCHGDRASGGKRLTVALGNDAGTWTKAIRDAVPAISKAVDELNASGAEAIVLYRNATACADTAAFAMRSHGEARQAAILGCADALTCSLDRAATTAAVAGRDSTGSPPQSHVVVAADHDDVVTAIVEMVESAGLNFKAATPIDSVIMARLIATVLKGSTANAAYLYVGDHRSFFVIADKGNILFARPINLGTDSLVSSMTRPIRTKNGTEPVELSHAEAREILHNFGFPERDQVVHADLGLSGAQIIPLLQPVLQRFLVELRQSLRFGVVEERRADLSLTISGPGAPIPNFSQLIATELKLKTTTDSACSNYDYRAPDSAGCEIADALEDPKLLAKLGLQPRKLAQAKHVNRLRRWMWTGAAAAIAVIGMDFMHYQSRLKSAREEVENFASQTTDIKALQSTGEKLFAVVSAMESLENRIAKETGSTINVRACLQELSRVVPESVRLTSISFNLDKGKTVGSLAGYAFENSNGPGRSELEPFVQKLKISPLFDDVVLANVRAGTVQQFSGQQFEVRLTGVSVPHNASASAPEVAVAIGETKP